MEDLNLLIFFSNLSPKETFLAKYEMNSINTSRGSRAIGQPAGTNKEKNLRPCFLKLKVIDTTVKLEKKE